MLNYSRGVPRPDIAAPNLTVQQLEYLVAVADAPTWAVAAGAVGVMIWRLLQLWEATGG